VTLGRQLRRPDLSTTGARWCEAALPERSVDRFLARERARLFPPELFADLFEPTGRRSVPVGCQKSGSPQSSKDVVAGYGARRVLPSRWRCWWSGRSSIWRCAASLI